jgi:hypothetical protein
LVKVVLVIEAVFKLGMTPTVVEVGVAPYPPLGLGFALG